MSKCVKASSAVLALVGVGLLSAGLLVPDVIDAAKEEGIREQVIIGQEDFESEEPSDTVRWWFDNSVEDAPPVYQKVFVWNILNAEEFITSRGNNTKLEMEDKGPYTFRKYTKRFNATWQTDRFERPTLRYHEWITYEFDQENSCDDCSLDDTFIGLNLPFIGIHGQPFVSTTQPSGFDAYPDGVNVLGHGLMGILADATGWSRDDEYSLLFVNKTAGELIRGYENGDVVPAHPGVLTNDTIEMAMEYGWHTILTGESAPGDTMEYVEFQNMTDVVTPTIEELPDDLDLLLSLLGIDPATKPLPELLPVWGSSYANRITGTAGDQFRRDLQRGDAVTAYVSDVYRSVPLLNTDGATVRLEGIELLKMLPAPTVFLNVEEDPTQAEYYNFQPYGTFNIERARSSVPVFVSLPHFYDADPSYLDRLEGMQPTQDDHELFLGVEPNTGLTMLAKKRSQVNLRLPHQITIPQARGFFGEVSIPEHTLFEAIGEDDIYVPFVWMEETGQISSSLADEFRGGVYFAETMRDVVQFAGLGVGIACVCLSLFLALRIPSASRNGFDGMDSSPLMEDRQDLTSDHSVNGDESYAY